jgi:hypothetical protein
MTTGLAALTLAGTASADTLPVSVVCQQPLSQHCSNPFLTLANNNGDGMFVQFTASPEHCSSILATIAIDGKNLRTELLAPGQTMAKQFVGGTSKPNNGLTAVEVKADGVLGGCNTGTLPAWKGTLVIRQFGEPPNTKPVRPIGHLRQATVTADVDVYDNPNGDGESKGFLKKGAIVTVKAPCTSDAFCALTDGTFVWGEFLENK